MNGKYFSPLVVLTAVLYMISSVSGEDQQKLATMRQDKTGRRVASPKNDVDAAIVRALETLRKLMPTGIPELGVPALEPFTLDHHDLNIQSELATLTGSLDDLAIANLSTFRLEYVSSDIQNLREDFVFSFDRITISGLYNITGQLMDSVNVFGNGAFSHVVDGLVVRCRAHLARESGDDDRPTKIDKLQIRFSIKGMQSNSENFMGGGDMGELMNKVVSESAPEFIQQHQRELSSLLATTVKDLVNPLLGQYSLKEILRLLDMHRSE